MRFLVETFNLITEDDIIQVKGKNRWYIRERLLTEGEIKNLKSEADLVSRTKIWQYFINELKWHAQVRAADAKVEEDLIAVNELKFLVKTAQNYIDNIINK